MKPNEPERQKCRKEACQDQSYVPPPGCGSSEIPPEILNAELCAISKRRNNVFCQSAEKESTEADSCQEKPEKIKDNLVGLALSGGGIRSATFSLGVMQRLAKKGWLKHVDYLSTVSGGGYIGGSLTWLLNANKGFGTNCANFPFGVDDPTKKRRRRNEFDVLTHLRRHGEYLIPGDGITWTSLIAVILRGIVLNLVVWLPLAIVIMIALLLASCALGYAGDAIEDIYCWNVTWSGLQVALADVWNAIEDFCMACRIGYGGGLDLLLCLAVLMGLVFLFFSVIYSFFTWRPIPDKLNIPKGFKDPYRRRRTFEKWIRWAIWIAIPSIVLGSIPAVVEWLNDPSVDGIGSTAPFTIMLGIVGGLWSFVRSGRSGRIPVGILAAFACILILFGLALTTYVLAVWWFSCVWFKWALLLGLVISIATGTIVNLNYISIHRYYRDRLMEAFMPKTNSGRKICCEKDPDKAELSAMCSKHAPYHLLNTNVVLVNSCKPRFKKRGGDAFLLSPKYCGSTATGWIKTASYMQKDALTLPTAVAISGAAANPNTAAGGSGPTRKPLLSLLMALLNVRLGYWVPHPCPSKHKRRRVATHFRAAYHELSPRGYAEHQNLLQISDGGHFENLGVYELVRRRVKLIICCDGSTDPEFRFKDLQVMVRRIGADFGARIEFDRYNHLERLIPRDPDPQKVIDRDPGTEAYPVGVKFADRGYIKGTICYANGDSCKCTDRDRCNCADRDESKGVFILIKSTMIKNLGIRLKGYKGANPEFPDQSTADQFFDEEQFEAYRELGYEITRSMTCELNLQNLLRK